MPQQFQVRFSERKAFGMAVEVTNLWEVTLSFLKEEALRFENDLPWLLESIVYRRGSYLVEAINP